MCGAGYAHMHVHMNLYLVVGVILGYIGDAPTLLKVEELVHLIFKY